MFLSSALILLLSTAIVRGQSLPSSSRCDEREESGTANIAGKWAPPQAETCMEGKETAEDRWFRENVCKRWEFQCAPNESEAACSAARDQACEHQRTAWLGNFTLIAKPPIDTTGTLVQTPADGTVRDTGAKSWFDNTTPLADFSAADESPFCQTRPSSWQEEQEFIDLMDNTDPLPFAECPNAVKPAGFDSYPQTIKGLFHFLMDNVWNEMHPDGKDFAGTSEPTVRKDMRTMSNSDRIRYLKAIEGLYCLGAVDLWAAIHATSPADLHSGPGFLPAHSIFMRIYEMSLQTFGGLPSNMGLAIGGWAVDETLPRWHNGRIRFSSIFGNDYFGSIANQNIGGETLDATSEVFGAGKWKTPSPAADSPELSRSFRNVERRGGYISAQMIWAAMAIEDKLTFTCQMERSILHGGHHMVIGGHMGNLLAASNDPLFFAHHGFVDCVWRNWQMQGKTKDERASAASFPRDTPDWWSRHRPEHTAHWTKWTSSGDNVERELTHEQSWNYRNKGKGSYKCIVPSLLPCHRDEDCGVSSGQAREDKRLYCSVAGVCSQYVETNAICRNEYGSFLPCQKLTDRCQYAPNLWSKYNTRGSPSESDPSAWFCVESPALKCGAHKDESSCAADTANGCDWANAEDGVQKCDYEVPAFGFGVVEDAPATLQSFGAEVNFLSNAVSTGSNTATVMTDVGVKATVTAVKAAGGGNWAKDGPARFHRDELGFGIDTRNSDCPSSAVNTIDGEEAIQIEYDQEVVLAQVQVSNFAAETTYVIELWNGKDLLSLQVFNARDIVLGETAAVDGIVDCGDKVNADGACVITKVVIAPSIYGGCGGSFSVNKVVATITKEVTGKAGTPSSFTGYCTGAPGGDHYTDCANEDRCFMSPATDPSGNKKDVQVILVPAGKCGPKGWYPQIEYKQGSGSRLDAVYKKQCTCGTEQTLTGTGPIADTAGRTFRPMLPLSRVQDRLAGNDDARRMEAEENNKSSAASIVINSIALLVAFVVAF